MGRALGGSGSAEGSSITLKGSESDTPVWLFAFNSVCVCVASLQDGPEAPASTTSGTRFRLGVCSPHTLQLFPAVLSIFVP